MKLETGRIKDENILKAGNKTYYVKIYSLAYETEFWMLTMIVWLIHFLVVYLGYIIGNGDYQRVLFQIFLYKMWEICLQYFTDRYSISDLAS